MMSAKQSATSTVIAAALAHDSYNNTCREPIAHAPGWKPYDLDTRRAGSSTPLDGFFGRAYFHHQKRCMIIAFRGSETKVDDWATNVRQWAVGACSNQYRHALALAREAQDICGKNGYRLLGYTGHSLGGGLAAMVSLATGSYAVTFNPAPIRRALPTGMQDAYIASHVMNYVSSYDFVSRLNPFLGVTIEAMGAAAASAQGGVAGFAIHAMRSLNAMGTAIGEAAAAISEGPHKLIPGITLEVKNGGGHSMEDLLSFLTSRSEYQLDPWP